MMRACAACVFTADRWVLVDTVGVFAFLPKTVPDISKVTKHLTLEEPKTEELELGDNSQLHTPQ